MIDSTEYKAKEKMVSVKCETMNADTFNRNGFENHQDVLTHTHTCEES